MFVLQLHVHSGKRPSLDAFVVSDLAYNNVMKQALVLLLCLVPSVLVGQESPDNPIDFNRQVKPILSDRCFLCHGPDEATRTGGVRLDQEDSIKSALTVGDAADSDLFQRITSDEEDYQMPPADSNLSLLPEEKEILKRWIDQGAKWEAHWSFVAPKQHQPPVATGKFAQWPANEIDQFLLARLETEKLSPAPEASKEKLIRRVSFDLTGLPPTLDEIDKFIADESEDAYEKVVDRLLASTRYGERMTSDWLDLARYSDSYGYQVDRNRFVWPWRDWVVGAFNQNMPYDQFLTEQLAGDLLPDATDQQILATTFNRLHPQKVEGGSVEEEFRVEYVADRSQTVGMAFLGLTVECARCHDHKYDPLSQKEYYELFAFFNNIEESGLYSYFDPEAIPTPSLLLADEAKKKQLADLQSNISQLERELLESRRAAEKDFVNWFRDQDAAEKLTLRSPEPEDEEKENAEPAEKESENAEPDQDQEPAKSEEVATPAAKPSRISGLQVDVDFEKIAKDSKDGNKLVDIDGGKALQLTGDDPVKIESGAFERHSEFTITARIKIPNNEKLLERSVIYHRSRAWTDSASRGYQLLIKNGRLSASLIHFWPGNAISVETNLVPVEKWIDVAFVYDGSSRADGIKIFIDGKPAKTTVVKDNLQKKIVGKEIEHLQIGARFRDIGFKKGQIAELKVFERALTRLEILQANDETVFDSVLDKPLEELTPAERQLALDYFVTNYDPTFVEKTVELASARKAAYKAVNETKEIMVMRELPQPRPAFVLERGAYDAPKDPVNPGTPAAFPPMAEDQPANRLGLARWMTAPDHPLTARVAVNHYWQLLFGNGLVRTPEDFGNQGQAPTHPKLLDWLAVDFQKNGWDTKRLLKQIVTSQTYRQSTAASKELLKLDPDNELLARAPTYRLPAEMIRDNVLFTSGLIVEKIGGAPVRPYELERSFKPAKPDQGEGLYRRSLYTFWQRTGPAPVMLTLDAAKRDVCQVKRERTSSPLAALVQLNNPQTVEAARELASRLIQSSKSEKSKGSSVATDMFRTLTSRSPTDQELEILNSLYESQLEYFRSDKKATKAFLDVGHTKTKTKAPAKLAAWASVANTLFSFDECVMKR